MSSSTIISDAMIAQTIREGKVWAGTWSPTGQKVYLVVEDYEEPPAMVETNCPNDYPPERQFIEMTLVRMFNDRRRCWADYCDIADALSTIRMHAEDMDRERRMFNEAEGCSSEPEQGDG